MKLYEYNRDLNWFSTIWFYVLKSDYLIKILTCNKQEPR